MRTFVAVLFTLAIALPAHALYRCDVNGKIVYQGTSCDESGKKPQYRCNINGQVVYQETSCVVPGGKALPDYGKMTAQELQAHFEQERAAAEQAKSPPKAAVQGQVGAAKPASVDRSNDRMWIIQNEDLIRRRMRDPGSASFRDSYVSRSSGSPIVCGYVNGKNGFGGYTGFQRFVSAGSVVQVIELPMKSGEMDELWRNLCD